MRREQFFYQPKHSRAPHKKRGDYFMKYIEKVTQYKYEERATKNNNEENVNSG